MAFTVVHTLDSARSLLTAIEECPVQPPFLFIDLEGVNLSRHGSVATLQILIPPTDHMFVVGVHGLQRQAFGPVSLKGSNLKSLLESDSIAKIFFDVRNDSDALYSHFQIRLDGIGAIQLLEFATRIHEGRFLRGLAKCINEDAGLGWAERRE